MPLAEFTWPIIKNEIQTDPKNLGYAGKDYATQAMLMNQMRSQSPQVFVSTPVPVNSILVYLLGEGKFEGILNAANNPSATGHSPAFIAIQFLQHGSDNVDLTNPIAVNTFAGLVTAGLITQAESDYCMAMKNVEVLTSRAQSLGIGVVEAGDVQAALTQ